MNIELRERQERLEFDILSEYASFSVNTLGRCLQEEKCDIRTDFQRDRDRIIHSKAFRRLKHKTQVFIAPSGDHFRTRLTHTLEVSQIARTISRALRLNEDLTEAIALGHDLGHTPFGHSGESVLNNLLPGGFRHNEQSLRVVDMLEKNGSGLNLTFEVRDGILNHRGTGTPHTLEGKVVQLSDKIAYVNHDIEDAYRAGVIVYDDLLPSCVNILGKTKSQRINSMIRAVIVPSLSSGGVYMDNTVKDAMYALRAFLFENVYNDSRRFPQICFYENAIAELFNFYINNMDILFEEFQPNFNDSIERIVCDYVAGMTDSFAISKCEKYLYSFRNGFSI